MRERYGYILYNETLIYALDTFVIIILCGTSSYIEPRDLTVVIKWLNGPANIKFFEHIMCILSIRNHIM